MFMRVPYTWTDKRGGYEGMNTQSDKVRAALRLLGVGPILSPEQVRQHNEAAREKIDAYWTGTILPALTRLHAEGKLPTLDVPEWGPAHQEWGKAAEESLEPCDAERVRRLMAEFIRAMGGTVEPGNRNNTTN